MGQVLFSCRCELQLEKSCRRLGLGQAVLKYVDGSGKQLTLSWTDEEKPDSQTPPWQCCLLYFAGDSFLLKSSEVRL
ncbi:tRNA (cytosine(34)-C(5))-methyltransferase [Trichinella pseudospiralis]